MAEVVLFHAALGLTPGVTAFADDLRAAGHTVHTPDLFAGRTFEAVTDGVAHAREIGSGELADRGARAVADLPAEVVYAGMSLGVLPAQQLAQTRAGARGALFLYSCLPPGEFGPWPAGVPLQVHGMDADPLFVDDGDLDAARELVAAARATGAGADLYLYPGDQHYFADRTLPSYDAEATAALTRRALDLLAGR
ncbi:dienelactone hydrolase family protein [Geodermatophilus sp. SYSU D01119]